jgi:hypothetical protein
MSIALQLHNFQDIGQLKYYPLIENAIWKSEIFSLEPLPPGWSAKHSVLKKARDYFPRFWEALEQLP